MYLSKGAKGQSRRNSRRILLSACRPLWAQWKQQRGRCTLQWWPRSAPQKLLHDMADRPNDGSCSICASCVWALQYEEGHPFPIPSERL